MAMERIQLEENLNDKDLIKEFEIVKRFKSQNILKERVDLYRDFSINLLHFIYDTYLGKEYIKSKHDIIGHYNWCFGKVLEDFFDQEIDFYGNDELYNYFLGYYYDQFYKLEKPQTINHYKKLWNDIFSHNKSNKPKNRLDVLVELYQIFDKSLQRKHIEAEVI